MKSFSKESIEVAEKKYTLFLNREGIVAWEKFAAEENARMEANQKKFANVLSDKNAEITDDTNPFENIEGIEDETENVSKSYRKLYWIMLYTNHKLSLKDVDDLYDNAIKEYGEAQLIQLAVQMLEDANTNKMESNLNEIKKLPALKPREK